MYYSNSDLGYTFAFYRYAISKITENKYTHDQLALFKHLKTLLYFRSGYINKQC